MRWGLLYALASILALDVVFCQHPVLVVFPEMIDRGIYHDLSKPAFKGAYHIGIRRLVMMYLPEYFQEAVIQYLNGIG